MSIPRLLDCAWAPTASHPGPTPWPGRPVVTSARSGATAVSGVRALLLLLALAAACVPVLADANNAAAQQERIARERATVEHEAQAAQAACAQQFAVTACVDRVKADRRERLRQLDRERALLDDELRKRRAAERVGQIEQRKAEQGQEQPAVSVRTRSPTAGVAPKAPARTAEAGAAAHEAAASQSEADASERAAASAQRAAQAQEHRIAVERRNRDRAALHAPAASLPQPPQAPASQ